MYKRKGVQELYERLEEIEVERFLPSEWIDSEMVMELYSVVQMQYFNISSESHHKISRQDAIEFLNFMDAMPIEIYSMLANGSGHANLDFLRPVKKPTP